MDFLKEIFDRALYEKVCEALKGKGRDGRDLALLPNDGSFVPLAKFNELLQQKRQLEKEQVDKEELAGLREQIKELARAKVELFIDQQLSAMRVKNAAAARALLAVEEGCEDLGIVQAEIDRVRQENTYLFDEEAPRFTGIILSDGLDIRKQHWQKDFPHLSEQQRVALKQEDRQGYRRAVEQHVKKARKVL